jgi:putative aminopeptidase FrvX
MELNLEIRSYVNPKALFNLNRLADLVSIYAPSRHEEAVAQYLIPILEKHCYRIERDSEGNVCAWRRGEAEADTVLLCAHMDTVSFPQAELSYLIEDGYLKLDQSKIPRETDRGGPQPAVLGADDRAGIEAILSILDHYSGPLNLRILFSTKEEVGGEGVFDIDKRFLEEVTFGLVLDRRNTGDIVTRIEGLHLAPKPLIKHVRNCALKMNIRNVREVAGSFSDAYFLVRRNRVPCLNLSTAYFFPHSYREVLDLYGYDDCIGWYLDILDSYTNYVFNPPARESSPILTHATKSIAEQILYKREIQ